MSEEAEVEVVKPERPFTQLVVWRSMIVADGNGIENFIEAMKEEYDFDVKYAEEYETLPGRGGEGGRNDVLFYVHEDGINRFAPWRMQFGGAISWWEDHKRNESVIIPDAIKAKYIDTWDASIPDDVDEENIMHVCSDCSPNNEEV